MIKSKGSENKLRANQGTVDIKSLESRSNTELWKAVEEMMDKPVAEIDGDFVDACLSILQDRAPVAEDYNAQATLQRLYDEHPAIFNLEEKVSARTAASRRKPLFRYVGAFAAAMLCFVVTANALGYNPIQVFMRWFNDTIQIYSDPSGLMELPPDAPVEYHSLDEALEGCGASSADRITWIPEDYSIVSARVIFVGDIAKITAIYEADRGELAIRILKVEDSDWNGVVESGADKYQYEYNGTVYYVTANYEAMKVGWGDGQYLYEVGGQISEDEIKKMIHSIA